MTHRGYILLHRKLLDSGLWQQPPVTVKTAIDLILSCNHRPWPWATITIERGETFRTIGRMVAEVSLSAPTLRKALSNLETAGFIKRTTPLGKNRGFLIKVINYDEYQSNVSTLSDTSFPDESPELNSTDKSLRGTIQKNSKKHLNNSCSEIEQQAEEIYNIYPRKTGKPRAIQTIKMAINKYGFNHLIERTKLYAQLYNSDRKYIPYPGTFFNQERFNDDPSEWSNNTKRTATQFRSQKISNHNFITVIKKGL